MGRAEYRRAQRAASKKKNATEPPALISEQMISRALWEKQLTEKIDRELGNRYYRQASKESCDNMYYIMMCSMALVLHDCNPNWGSEPIGKRLQLTMEYVDRFAKEWNGDIQGYIKKVEEETGLIITVDSVPAGEGEGGYD